jgi:hypothetical protein
MPASLPVWVPFLLVALTYVGYRQSLPRVVKPAALAAVALAMLGFSLFGVASSFGADPLALVLWAAGYLVAILLGARTFASRGLVASGSAVRVPGSWVPLVLILGIFAIKSVLGYATAVHSTMLQQAGFVAGVSLALGALSGGFGAQAVAVRRCAIRSA